MKKHINNWKKPAEKFAIALVEIAIAGFIAWSAENPIWLGLVPLAEAVRNIIKHRDKYKFK